MENQNAALDAIIDAVAGSPAPEPSIQQEAAPLDTAQATEPAVETKSEPGKVVELPKPAAAVVDKSFAAVVAAAQKQRDERLKWEAERKAAEEQAAKSRDSERENWKRDFLEKFELDPASALAEFGITKDYSRHAKRLWAKELGQDAPAELKQEQALTPIMQEVKALRAELKAAKEAEAMRQQQIQQAQEREAKAKQIQADLQALPDTFTYLKAVAETDPAVVHGQLLAMADDFERMYGQRPPIEALAEKLEQDYSAKLKPLVERFVPKTNATVATSSQASTQSDAAKTLSNALTSQTKPRTAAKSDEELEQEVIEDLETGAWKTKTQDS